MILSPLPAPKIPDAEQSIACLNFLLKDCGLERSAQLSFSQYMDLALYHPLYGYYTAKKTIFGKDGDFITAPSSSSFFGKSLAHVLSPLLTQLGPKAGLIEFGPGNGDLANILSQELIALNTPPAFYGLIEHELKKTMPEIPSCTWLKELPQDFEGIILANELLDAMPYERLKWDGQQWLQSMVVWNKSLGLHEIFIPIADPDLINLLEKIGLTSPECQENLPAGFKTELSLAQNAWLKNLSKHLKKGLVFLIDYGSYNLERYRPSRSEGSLRAYYQHLVHEGFFAYPGIQDLTADVDFSLIAQQALEQNFELIGFNSQAAFLMGSGILEQKRSPTYKESQELQLLLQSTEMGERVKILALAKGLNTDLLKLPCFSLQDWSYRL